MQRKVRQSDGGRGERYGEEYSRGSRGGRGAMEESKEEGGQERGRDREMVTKLLPEFIRGAADIPSTRTGCRTKKEPKYIITDVLIWRALFASSQSRQRREKIRMVHYNITKLMTASFFISSVHRGRYPYATASISSVHLPISKSACLSQDMKREVGGNSQV